MTSAQPYYQTGEGRSGRVHDLFGEIAPRYDSINDLQSFGLHRAWKRKLVELAGVQPGMTVLDVCCGAGDIAFALPEPARTLFVAQRWPCSSAAPYAPAHQRNSVRLPLWGQIGRA